MTMSIPAFFKAVTLANHEIVDGGLRSNFAIRLFDTPEGTPRLVDLRPVPAGLNHTAPISPTRAGVAVKRIRSDIDFLESIAETPMVASARFDVEQATYDRTVQSPPSASAPPSSTIPPQKTK